MEKLSIIVPFRNREEHLEQFLPTMEKLDLLEDINFEILIIEQEEGKPFNRGKLLNVGAKESDSTYYCFHDVDMIPIVSDYSSISNPTHLAAEAEQFGYKLPYDGYFGGVTLFDRASFYKINGFSNDYWGWGAEDDDIMFRCKIRGVKTFRKNGRYKSLSHEREIKQDLYSENLKKFFGFKNSNSLQEIEELINSDGLDNLKYEILSDERISDKSRKIKVKI
jgi:predicted glycosyltransferase involved in capsule biosynthesis